MAVQIVEKPIETLPVIIGELRGHCLQLRISETRSIEFRLFSGCIFVLQLILQNGKAFRLKCGILVLHENHSLSVDRV